MGDLDIQVIEDWYLNVTKNRGLRVRSSSIISPIKNKKATLPLIAITNNWYVNNFIINFYIFIKLLYYNF